MDEDKQSKELAAKGTGQGHVHVHKAPETTKDE
jgi:hypothetical protein